MAWVTWTWPRRPRIVIFRRCDGVAEMEATIEQLTGENAIGIMQWTVAPTLSNSHFRAAYPTTTDIVQTSLAKEIL